MDVSRHTLLLFIFKWIFVAVHSAALSYNNSDASMASIDFTQVPIVEKPLHVPPLEEIVDVLSRGLRSTFETVEVSAEDSPDLTQDPYNLVTPGLCGSSPIKLVEVGGPPYLVPRVQRDKVYSLRALLHALRRPRALLAGAGAGPWPYAGRNCEGIVNLYINEEEGIVEQGTRIVTVEADGGYRQQRLPPSETRSALLGNYLLTDGLPGKVIKVVAKKRIGQSNFITAIRETLKKHYGDKVVGLGGMFLLREGRVKHHVMPDFSSTAICSDAAVEAWLRFYEMRAPITHLGTLVTGDLGLDLRVQHFHGFSVHGDGGHYHYDTTPDRVHYEGYFVPAAAVLRVDAPTETHTFGRD